MSAPTPQASGAPPPPPPGVPDVSLVDEEEQNLWENSSSFLVAVSPTIFENNRIRLKVALGYRVRSQVHALPSLAGAGDASTTAGALALPSSSASSARAAGSILEPAQAAAWLLHNAGRMGWKSVIGLLFGAAALFSVATRPRGGFTAWL